jgi:1-acyl-sn-glycerol-3-phosphate acyltransferase
MIAFIVSMCIALPATLVPQHLLYRLKLISRVRQNKMALVTGEFCARWLLRLIPFCKVECTSHHDENPEPSIWVCNHSSALDVFILLAADKRLRGKHRRPMKIIYVSDFIKISSIDPLCVPTKSHLLCFRLSRIISGNS